MACAALGTAVALEANAGAEEQELRSELRSDPLFQQLDSNHDGRISRAEAARLPDFLVAFEAVDTGKTGWLSAQDYLKARLIYHRIRAAQFLSDRIITAKVKAYLQRDMELPPNGIEVQTQDGQVFLNGQVERAQQRVQAGRIAASIAGVTGVKNSLQVKETAARPAASGGARLASP